MKRQTVKLNTGISFTNTYLLETCYYSPMHVRFSYTRLPL